MGKPLPTYSQYVTQQWTARRTWDEEFFEEWGDLTTGPVSCASGPGGTGTRLPGPRPPEPSERHYAKVIYWQGRIDEQQAQVASEERAKRVEELKEKLAGMDYDRDEFAEALGLDDY